MADNVVISAGTGTTVAADEVVDGTLGTVKVQYVKLMDGTLDGTTKASIGAAGLKVDLSGTAANATAIKVDGTGGAFPATQSGTWSIGTIPSTSGGLTAYHLVSGASTNATNIKASAGQVYGWYIYNSNAAARKVAFHNTAGTPTAGSGVVSALVIPAGGAANVEFSNGIAFSTGIAITTVTGLPDSDSTGVAANDLVINIFYK